MKSNGNIPAELSSLGLVTRALKHRNYRLFFAGQGVSLIGTWMQQVALSWLVYRNTNSAFLLGVVGFAGQIPILFIAPFAGVLADRYNRHRIMIITQVVLMFQAFGLWALYATDSLSIWRIVILSLVMGFVNSFDMPTRQSFLIEMIEEREDLGNAIALNSSMVNMARLIGPSLAGILVAVAGEGVCFLINAISFLAVIASLLAMRITPHVAKEAPNDRILPELKEGFLYSFRTIPIRNTLALLALVSMFGVPYMTLMPVFAKDILHGGPHTLGFLVGSAGLGALSGAIFLASRRTSFGMEKIIPAAAGMFGIGLLGFGLSRFYVPSLLILVVVGCGMMMQLAGSNTLVQTAVDDDKRSRVMSMYMIAFLGMAPFGNLMAGTLAGAIGAPGTIMISGVVCIAGAIIYSTRLGDRSSLTERK